MWLRHLTSPYRAPLLMVRHYQPDGYSGRVVVFPATCRRGFHRLGVTGYRATEGDNGVLRVRCEACRAETATDAVCLLHTSGPVANQAELDDQPYVALFLAT